MELAKVKKILKLTTMAFGIIVAMFLFFSLGIIFIDYKLTIEILKSIFSLAFIVVLIIDIGAILLYFFLSLLKKESIIKNTEYIRDIPKEIPVGVAALLIDFHIDNERDYTATIASLIEKGYIEIKDNDEFIVHNKEKNELLNYEKIVINALISKTVYKDIEEDFKTAIRLEAVKRGLIEKTKKSYGYIMSIVFLIGLIFVTKYWSESSDSFLPTMIYFASIILALLTYIIMIIFYKEEPINEKYQYRRTALGEEYEKKLSGLKNFIHDYTLLKEKGLIDTILYEDYIAYAITVGEASAIEEFILNNSKYRNLVLRKDTI